jgi:hypothetical protein
MASEVKGAHCGILKIFSSVGSLLSEAVDLRHLVCTAFFITGLQPTGCTKQLNRIDVGQPFAGTNRLQALRLAPRKSCVPHVGSSRRRTHAPGSVASSGAARREGSLGARSKSSAPPGTSRAAPGANPSDEVGNCGARVPRGIIVPNDEFLAAPWWRSSLACLRSAVWLPGTVGRARLGRGHGLVSFSEQLYL